MILSSKRTVKLLGASVVLLALVWQHIEATRLGYQVEKSRRDIHILQGRIGSLNMELETGLSPAQLAQQARSRLGMFPASPESLRVLGGTPASSAGDGFLSRLLTRSWRSLTLPQNT